MSDENLNLNKNLLGGGEYIENTYAQSGGGGGGGGVKPKCVGLGTRGKVGGKVVFFLGFFFAIFVRTYNVDDPIKEYIATKYYPFPHL